MCLSYVYRATNLQDTGIYQYVVTAIESWILSQLSEVVLKLHSEDT